MWNKTSITQLLGIRYPILQGPMGGGFSTIDLLTAVSETGGLGSFGVYTFTPEQILETGAAIRQRTDKPFNLNLWVNDVDAERLAGLSPEKLEDIKKLFKPYFDDLGIPMPKLNTNIASKFERQVEAVLQIKPAVFSFIFGVPDAAILAECRRLNIKTVGAATTRDDGLLLEEAGVDAIVAAGFEAGGHRPSFLKPAEDSLTGMFSLVSQLKATIKAPIIAAGGIVTARDIAATITLGADAVQLGTAFLPCPESGVAPAHRSALLSDQAKHTVLSKSLTGRMGRMLGGNRIADEVDYQTEVLPFPLHTHLLAPLKRAAAEQGRTELVNYWSGQNTASLKRIGAGELVTALAEEVEKILS